MGDTHLVRVLKLAMDQRGLNPSSLARAAGLKKDAVRNIFRGKSGMPRASTLKAIADVLQVSVDYLVGGSEREDVVEDTTSGGKSPAFPTRRPGLKEWLEVQRAWNALGPEGRKAITYMARMAAHAEGVDLTKKDDPDGT